MKLFLVLALMVSLNCFANDTTRYLYNPYAQVEKDLHRLLSQARSEKKYLFLQVGNNGCVMCYRFNSFVQLNAELKQVISNNYIVYHLNYSKENRNLEYMKRLGNPERFGFPVFVILDENGNRLHTQNSSLLQKGNGYDHDKVKSFFQNWAPKGNDPSR